MPRKKPTRKMLNALTDSAGLAMRKRFLEATDNFTLARALYWYCVDNNSGQNSDEYEILSWLTRIYKPGANETGTSNQDGSSAIKVSLENGIYDPLDVLRILENAAYHEKHRRKD